MYVSVINLVCNFPILVLQFQTIFNGNVNINKENKSDKTGEKAIVKMKWMTL